jgi:hypothetical protein
MFYAICAILLTAVAGLCFARYSWLKKSKEKESYYDQGGTACLIVACCFVGLMVLHTAILYRNQLADFEVVKFYGQTEQIYKNKAEALTAQFASHLAITYPNHEKEIFKNIAPGQVNLYLVKYPELQASKTLVVLVEQINKLQADYYQQQIEREKVLATIRYRPKSPFAIGWFITKTPPANIAEK